jgi:hypothetical protein
MNDDDDDDDDDDLLNTVFDTNTVWLYDTQHELLRNAVY